MEAWASRRPLDRGPQETLHLRADIALPLPPILEITLPKVVSEEQRVLGRGTDDVGRRPKKAADGDGEERVWLRRPLHQESFFPAELQEQFAVERAQLPDFELPRQLVIPEIGLRGVACQHTHDLRLQIDFGAQLVE